VGLVRAAAEGSVARTHCNHSASHRLLCPPRATTPAVLLVAAATCLAASFSTSGVSAQPARVPVESLQAEDTLGPRVALDGTPVPPGHDARGTAVLSLSGGVPLLMPHGVSSELGVGYGFELTFVVRTWAPVMLGVSVGRASFGSSARSDGAVLSADDEGVTLSRATALTDLSLSHLSAALRYEPYWGPIRPFVELTAGPTMLWTDYSVSDSVGRELESDSKFHSFGLLSGAALGFDIPFSRDRWREHTPSYFVDLSVTLGARYWGTTPMRHPRLDDTLGVTRERAMMQAWVPFVALTWSAETHPEVIMRHRRSPQR
jgi:hypothetical protein